MTRILNRVECWKGSCAAPERAVLALGEGPEALLLQGHPQLLSDQLPELPEQHLLLHPEGFHLHSSRHQP